jgi:hypothetical protein
MRVFNRGKGSLGFFTTEEKEDRTESTEDFVDAAGLHPMHPFIPCIPVLTVGVASEVYPSPSPLERVRSFSCS